MKTEAKLRDTLQQIDTLHNRLEALADEADGLKVTREDIARLIALRVDMRPTYVLLHWILETPESTNPDPGYLTFDGYLLEASKFVDHISEDCLVRKQQNGNRSR